MRNILSNSKIISCFLLLVFISLFFPSRSFAEVNSVANFKVAYIGDQAKLDTTHKVLQLIRNEGAQFVVVAGDFDYHDDVNGWAQMMNDELTQYNIPYVVAPGNHDVGKWADYQAKVNEQLKRFPDVHCTGDLGVNSMCEYKGVAFMLSGVGTIGSNHVAMLQQELTSSSQYVWKVCSWHKNQQAMQIGGKKNEVGWEPYQLCREAGAIVATGHEHSYERTKTLVNMETQQVSQQWPDPNKLLVGPGSTFAFVSGLGGGGDNGPEVRVQSRCLPYTYPYGCNGEWAKIFSHNSPQFTGTPTSFGALFIAYNVDGNPRKAKGYYKLIHPDPSKNMIDQFEVYSENAKSAVQTCKVQGIKLLDGQQAAAATVISSTKVSIDGALRNGTESNPYFIENVAAGSHSVSLAVDPNKYDIGYTVCQNATDCHKQTPTAGGTATFNCSQGYVDLWWHVTTKINKSCSVSLSEVSAVQGKSVTATFTGTSSRATAEPVQIYLKKVNTTQISPAPAGTTEVANPPNYYYKFTTTCSTSNSQPCTGTVTIPPQAVGQYQVHCDMYQSPSACSGNPNCAYEGGTFTCGGWQSCSNSDNAALEVTAAPQTPPPTPAPTTRNPDYNGNHTVDIFDYNTLISHFGQTDCAYNLTGECAINQADFDLLVSQFGKPQ